MSRSQIAKHYTRIASLWPQDVNRQISFDKVTSFRTKQIEAAASSADPQSELRNVNALYTLLDDRYKKKYPIPKHVLTPQSNPTHYTALLEELEKAPKRSWWENWVAGLKGKIRFS